MYYRGLLFNRKLFSSPYQNAELGVSNDGSLRRLTANELQLATAVSSAAVLRCSAFNRIRFVG